MEIGSLGVPELLIILVVVLLLFGPRRLPEVARGLGKAVHDFRSGLQSGLEDVVGEGRAASAANSDEPRSEALQGPAASAGTVATPVDGPDGGGSAATPGRDY